MDDEERELVGYYDGAADVYASSRTDDAQGLNGLQNREIEQPTMFSLVPADLSGMKILDVGCGPGVHVHEYRRRGAEVFAIDPSEKLLAIAKQRNPDVVFEVASVYEIPFTDKFDIVTCSLVLDHVKRLAVAMKELKRVLKRGGIIFVSLPHPITGMFREGKKLGLKVTNSYFDVEPTYLNIARTGKNFISYPRTLQVLFDTFLDAGFTLQRFVEGRLEESLREKYPDLTEDLLKIPLHCFFVWKRGDS